jgi:hypothetical protein
MARTYDVRLGNIKNFNEAAQQLSTLSLATGGTVYEGSILREDADQATDKLVVGTDKAEFLLLERVTSDGPTDLERIFSIDVGEKKSGRKAGVALLAPGMEFQTKVFASTGDGAISSGTAIETKLGVVAGELVVKQTSGNGAVEFFILKENTVATDGFIRVLCTHVGQG